MLFLLLSQSPYRMGTILLHTHRPGPRVAQPARFVQRSCLGLTADGGIPLPESGRESQRMLSSQISAEWNCPEFGGGPGSKKWRYWIWLAHLLVSKLLSARCHHRPGEWSVAPTGPLSGWARLLSYEPAPKHV